MDLWILNIPLPLVLAVVATLGYLFGRRGRISNDTFTEVRTDPLTGVSNHRALDDTLAAQFALSSRYRTGFSLAIFDIDHFKQINDQQGHLYGDKMLKQLARLIDDAVRETDVVVRYGGDELVVIMPHTELAGAGIFAERVRRAVEEEMPLSISGGVATAIDGDSPESLLGRADEALYVAKSAGRNCVFHHTGDQAEAIEQDAEVVAV